MTSSGQIKGTKGIVNPEHYILRVLDHTYHA